MLDTLEDPGLGSVTDLDKMDIKRENRKSKSTKIKIMVDWD